MAALEPVAPSDLGIQVLVVDDDPDLRDLIAHVLRHRLGAVVTTAPDAYQALAELRAQSFDVLLLDLLMPGANGLDVLDRMESAGIEVPTIVVSGVASGPLVNELDQHHVFRVVTKPFDLVLLSSQVAAAGRRRRPAHLSALAGAEG
jgi:DNA-binding NtrC family response regulator